MSDEMERAKEIDDAVKAADAKRRADADAGEKLDNILKCLDSLGKRMDAFEKRPVEEAGESKNLTRGDGEGDQNSASGAHGPAGGAGARLPKMNDEDREEIEAASKERGDVRYPLAPIRNREAYADSIIARIQSQADRASSAWGKVREASLGRRGYCGLSAPYAREHQQHSPMWKDVDLSELRGQALRNATAQIFADSIAASSASESYGETLRGGASRAILIPAT